MWASRGAGGPAPLKLKAGDREPGDGFPIEFGHDGETMIVQPDDWQWEPVDEMRRLQPREGARYQYRVAVRTFRKCRTPEGTPIKSKKSWLDMTNAQAAWALNHANAGITHGCLVPGEAIGRSLDNAIAEKRKELDRCCGGGERAGDAGQGRGEGRQQQEEPDRGPRRADR